MAERKAVNKYYPPEWTPDQGSINTFRNSHPLRDRARKLGEGIMIVRFEMPFNIWCGGCEEHIGRGVRYNAEKKHIGNYFSTRIFQFRMKCHLCNHWIEIHTDPEKCDYVVVSGGRRKVETFEPTAEDHVIELKSKEEAQKLAEDPFYKLEHATEDKRKAVEDAAPALERLVEMMEPMRDDYKLSQIMRRKFREQKKEIANEQKLLEMKGLTKFTHLLPLTEADKEEAAKVKFRPKLKQNVENKRATERLLIKSASIFGAKNSEDKELKIQAAIKRRRLDPSLLKKPTARSSSSGLSLFS